MSASIDVIEEGSRSNRRRGGRGRGELAGRAGREAFSEGKPLPLTTILRISQFQIREIETFRFFSMFSSTDRSEEPLYRICSPPVFPSNTYWYVPVPV